MHHSSAIYFDSLMGEDSGEKRDELSQLIHSNIISWEQNFEFNLQYIENRITFINDTTIDS